MSGARRSLRIVPADFSLAAEADGLRLRFTLPRGSYATVLLAELMKSEGLAGEAEEAADAGE
jgi:tRNA pseudouridine13 synthase